MKIVIAPDSFKESLSARQVAAQIEAGFREIFPDAHYVCLPVADGGEGTSDALIAATNGQRVTLDVTGPTGETVSAFYGLSGDGRYAIIEMAAASGLERVAEAQRNPLLATSWGTGELICDALDRGIRHLIIGIGGSATNDGGAGMLQALGARLCDNHGQPVGYGGAALAQLASIDISEFDPRIAQCRIEVACDVTNPLTGEQGASAVFGPQKGATPQQVAVLDQALSHFAALIKRDLAIDVLTVAGGGAAGGMGAGLYAFCHAHLRPGIDIVSEALQLEQQICNATLVITGEGRIDSQTLQGKVAAGVARIAKRHNKPVIAIGGALSRDVAVVHQHGVDAVFSVLNRVCSLAEALQDAEVNLQRCARNIAASLALGRGMAVTVP